MLFSLFQLFKVNPSADSDCVSTFLLLSEQISKKTGRTQRTETTRGRRADTLDPLGASVTSFSCRGRGFYTWTAAVGYDDDTKLNVYWAGSFRLILTDLREQLMSSIYLGRQWRLTFLFWGILFYIWMYSFTYIFGIDNMSSRRFLAAMHVCLGRLGNLNGPQ